MAKNIIITQCLQNDFIAPIERYKQLPNLLHIGFTESKRLVGDSSHDGPLVQTIDYIHSLPEDEIEVLHIRDWHDLNDEGQKAHLRQFGEHCIKETTGARFLFNLPDQSNVRVIDSLTLNDFVSTNLKELLEPFSDQALTVGLVGVWTEAKITYLSYELKTRYPKFEIVICSALTASSTRHNHFVALEQLTRLLGVKVVHSVGQFMDLLSGTNFSSDVTGMSAEGLQINSKGQALSHNDETIIKYLFRDCRSIDLKVLDGGFSGNLVASVVSYDLDNHEQALMC
ncbi:MAG: isochorismatase family protein [Bdellovibrionales bacterium]|nr:isochorismatase family protein [Bdellovibrionales bacterium]